MEAPNSIKFQSISDLSTQKTPPTNHLRKFQQLYQEKVSNYDKRLDYSPKSPTKNTTWLEYSNGRFDSVDNALNKMNHQTESVLLKFSNVTKQHTGLSKVFDHLQQNKTVQHLIIRHSSLSAQIIKNIERVLQLNDGIAWLVLDHNDIDDNGVQDIANGLSENSSVEHVVLSDNNIGDRGAHALANMMATNHQFKTLFLQGNHISDVGIHALSDALTKRPPIDTIDVRDNPISETTLKQLEGRCHQLGIRCYT